MWWISQAYKQPSLLVRRKNKNDIKVISECRIKLSLSWYCSIHGHHSQYSNSNCYKISKILTQFVYISRTRSFRSHCSAVCQCISCTCRHSHHTGRLHTEKPHWLRDRQDLWEQVEAVEYSRAQPVHEFEERAQCPHQLWGCSQGSHSS